MTPHAHLTAARALIAEPGRWTQGMSGRTADGEPDLSKDLTFAVCFCALGALWRVAGWCNARGAESILQDAAFATTSFTNIVSFNDDPTTTHADVLRVFDVAIARAAKE